MSYELLYGDSFHLLQWLEDNSVDSVVTDPPYGWRFMGKAWDGADIIKSALRDLGEGKKTLYSDGKFRHRKLRPAQAAGSYDLSNTGNVAFQNWTAQWAKEVLRVLKPGGHMLVFCGPRTYHRMATGVEDAGFEVRDQLQWLFGSGFPKSLDISKAIDKAAGAKRKVVGQSGNWRPAKTKGGAGFDKTVGDGPCEMNLTSPATAAAAYWNGWGTALKPANEPILLARKPMSEKTVAKNVLRWSTGGLNIEKCRIAGSIPQVPQPAFDTTGKIYNMKTGVGRNGEISRREGRFPANLILDEAAAEMLDRQTGDLGKSQGGNSRNIKNKIYGKYKDGITKEGTGFGDTGGASRFFYVAKTSKRERGENNAHPTVKPIKLMQYLCRLVTPPNGVVLDPFLGSGSTGIAALKEGFRFIGIEKEKQYFEIAERRITGADF